MTAWTKDRLGNINLVVLGKQLSVSYTDKAHSKVMDLLREGADEQEIADTIDKCTALTKSLSVQTKRLLVEDGAIFYIGKDKVKEQVHGTIVERVMSFHDEGLPVKGLLNFIKKSMKNPSHQSVLEMYDFLEHKSLPICEDGDFLAYKAVTHDYKDKRTGLLDNRVGKTVKEPRRRVDDDRSKGCSTGLHVGTLTYVNGFGILNWTSTSDRRIICKVNPKHVVSVPTCSSCQKMRVEQYYVLKDYTEEMAYPLADDEGDRWDEPHDDDYAYYDPDLI